MNGSKNKKDGDDIGVAWLEAVSDDEKEEMEMEEEEEEEDEEVTFKYILCMYINIYKKED